MTRGLGLLGGLQFASNGKGMSPDGRQKKLSTDCGMAEDETGMDQWCDALDTTHVPRNELFDPQQLVQDIKVTMASKFEERGLTMVVDIVGAPLPTMMTDSTMLRSMCVNYLSNAIKHAEHTIRIVVSASKDWFNFKVHDDGGGVPVSFQSRLFKEYQIYEAREGSLGIGLASVKRQCTTLGGSCGHTDSSLLGGALFWFGVPLKGIAVEVDEVSEELEPLDEPFNVLIVDDSKLLCHALRTMLESQGHNAVATTSGQDALGLMQELHHNQASTYSVVLCAVRIGSPNGYELTQLVREWEAIIPKEAKQRQAIILLSGSDSVADRQLATKAGADAYACKLIKPAELFELMHKVVSDTVGNVVGSKSYKPCLLEALVLEHGIRGSRAIWGDCLREIEDDLKDLAEEPSWDIAHRLKGLFGVLYIRELFDQADKIQMILKKRNDNVPKVEISPEICTLISLYEMALLGGLKPDRAGFRKQDVG